MTLAEWLAEAEAGRVMYPPEVVAALVRVAMAVQANYYCQHCDWAQADEVDAGLSALDAALASPQGTL